MLQFKLKFAAVGMLAATLSMQSMAQEVATAQAPLSVDELSFAFAAVAQADVIAMSQGEMKETEGAVAPYLIGAGIGGGWYVGATATNAFITSRQNNTSFSQNFSNNFSWGQLAVSSGVSALTGGLATTALRSTAVGGNVNFGTQMFGRTTSRFPATNPSSSIPVSVQNALQRSPNFVQNLAHNQMRGYSTGAAIAVNGVRIGSAQAANQQYQTWTQPINTVQFNQDLSLNQQMLNQQNFGDFQRFANTQQNFQVPRFCVQVVTASGFSTPAC